MQFELHVDFDFRSLNSSLIEDVYLKELELPSPKHSVEIVKIYPLTFLTKISSNQILSKKALVSRKKLDESEFLVFPHCETVGLKLEMQFLKLLQIPP